MKRLLMLSMALGMGLTLVAGAMGAEEKKFRLPFFKSKSTSQQPGNPPPLPVEPSPVMPHETQRPPLYLPPPMPGTGPMPGPVVIHGAMKPDDFVKLFKPMAGTHKVMLIHPYTCCPVEVCFCLPCGCPKVKCDCKEIEFCYGREEVEIRFYRCGDVKVTHRKGCKLLCWLK